jgi:hypothetical protein
MQNQMITGDDFLNSGIHVQHSDLNNAFWKNEVTLASSNMELKKLEMNIEQKLRAFKDDPVKRTKALNIFKKEIEKLPGGATKVIEGTTYGIKPTERGVIQAAGKEFGATRYKDFANLLKSLCPKGQASGGRIGYRTAGAVTGTLECGINQFNKNMKTGNANSALMKRILQGGGNILKAGIQQVNPAELLKLRNLVGPQALGFFAAWEAGEITTDHLRKGTPWNEAFAKNWLTKSFMPFTEEFAKQKNLLQSGKLDTDSKRIYALDMMKSEKAWKEMNRIDAMKRNQLLDVGNYGMIDGSQMVTDESIADAEANVNRIVDDLESRGSLENTGMEMENIRAKDEKEATELAKDDWKPIRHMFSDDVLETWNIGKGFEDPFEPKVTRGQRIARAGKNAIVGHKVDYSRPTYPTLQQLAAGDRTNLTEQDVLNMYKDEGLISPTDYKSGMKLPPGELTWWRMQNPGRGIWGTQYNADGGRAGYMGGGIAAIRKPNALPPTGGPQSGGLPSLYNNGRKL